MSFDVLHGSHVIAMSQRETTSCGRRHFTARIQELLNMS
jgi:hypothetical protein